MSRAPGRRRRRWHVYVATGPTAASADFEFTWPNTAEHAKKHAATRWGVDAEHLRAHPVDACALLGCNG